MNALTELAREALEMLKPSEELTVSEWADRYRILTTETAAEPGRWHTDRAPYQRAIMDAFCERDIWQIVLMSSSQVGKSEIELNMLGWCIDQDPGPILYIQPDEGVAEDYSKRRIAPMIAATPALRRKVFSPKGRSGGNTIGMKMFAGGSLAIVGANSPSDLSSKPVKYIFMDETDEFTRSAGTEGDPQELAERRTETFRFRGRKVVKSSSPRNKRTSRILKDYMAGTQEEWRTQCPQCGDWFFIRFEQIKFEQTEFETEDGTRHRPENIRWECPGCGHCLPEWQVKRQPARWIACNEEQGRKDGIRSFRLNAFMSPWSSWEDICRKFLIAVDENDMEKLKTFRNTMLGEAWETTLHEGIADELYERREQYPAEVPPGVLVLTMGIDTQDNRLEYEVVGWDRDEQSWGIERGIIVGRADMPDVWKEVDSLLDREWQTAGGTSMRIMATFMDSGGHYTDEVYRECRRRGGRRMWAVKGEGGEKDKLVRPMKRTDDKAIRFLIAVDLGKEAILYNAAITDDGPKKMHFPTDVNRGYDQEYFKGLCSEHMVLHRSRGTTVMRWEKIYERNEPLDMRNYARAAYKYFKWPYDALEAAVKGEETRTPQRPRKPKNRVVSSGIRV